MHDRHTCFAVCGRLQSCDVSSNQALDAWSHGLHDNMWLLNKSMYAAYVAIGQTKGQTLLPLPATSGDSDQKLAGTNTAVPGVNKNKDALHLLENAVVTWTRQIKGALKATPQSAAAVRPLPELGNCWLEG